MNIMSIYIDPEEYYGSPEPEKLSDESEKYLRSVLMAVNWFQQDLAKLEVADEADVNETDKDDLPIGGYKYLGSIYTHCDE